MGRCRFCNREAGLLRREHADCERLNVEGVQRLRALVADSDLPPSRCAEEVRRVAWRHRVSEEQRQAALAEGWRSRVTTSLRAGELGREEEEWLGALLGEFGLSLHEVDPGGLWKLVTKRRKGASEKRIGELVSEAVSIARSFGMEADSGDASARTGRALASIEDAMLLAAEEGELSGPERREALIAGFEAEMNRLVASEVIADDHERALEAVFLHFRLDVEEKRKLNRNGVHERFVQALVLHDLAEGVAAQRQHVEGDGDDLPFRFKGSETLLWLFQGVEYRTTETKLSGVSIDGTGGVEEEERSVSDTGLLGVTTGHVYFAGSTLHFRIPHDRVVTLSPGADGIGLTQDRAEAKPEFFLLGDADFAYQLLRSIPARLTPAPSRPVVRPSEQHEPERPRLRQDRSVGRAGSTTASAKGPADVGETSQEDGCGEGCGKGCGWAVFLGIGLFMLVELFFQ